MENHFQTEAFNLDKVLDDFEQKQDETDSPSLSDKWIQILAPPAHLLSPNCALALTPDLGPLPLKTPLPPDPSSSNPQGPNAKYHPTAEPPPWGELPDCRADVQSPPLPQPNIGKLVGGEGSSASSSPPPYHHHSSISPSSPASPALNGLSEDPCKGNQTWVTPLDHHQPPTPSDPCTDTPVGERGDGSSHISHTHLTPPSLSSMVEAIAEKFNSKPETERPGALSPIQDSGREEAGIALIQSYEEGIPKRESHGNTVKNGLMKEGPTERKECRNSSQKQTRLIGEMEKESRGGQDGEMVLTSGMATEEEDRGSREEDRGSREEDRGSREEDRGSREGQSLPPPQSKEDSVTEEKEMEESSLENGGGDSSVPSILNTRLQLVSVPFGGARPKQPVTLKLQIPWPLSGQDQNQLSPTVNTTAVCKNKNLENRAGDITMETGTVVAGVTLVVVSRLLTGVAKRVVIVGAGAGVREQPGQ
ncbi:proline-rich receptor-like protein kinase PERK10 [Oncorhynchus tshawytscha]|uniref:proline-rich receptor-like protein kinase PERK10 n=1 Tax=Oncorhynchus tshawytscha TaxID=74940 RepID=UPI001C3D616F|nr:proline-rich receptor-like protein kinase PERK10 [Oncorhynchus tshawytscha]